MTTIRREDLAVGMHIAVLNNVFRGIVPYKVPLVITGVTPKRITAHPVCTEGRDPETWEGRDRYLDLGEIITIFPDEAEGRERSLHAFAIYEERQKLISDIEKQASIDIHAILRREL